MSRLRLENLGRRYGPTVAVDSVDLDVAQGELVALLGPSGCGKTTTLRMIAGFVSPSRGRIIIGENDVTSLPPYARDTSMCFRAMRYSRISPSPRMSPSDSKCGACRARSARTACWMPYASSSSMVWLSGCRTNCPADSSSASRWREPWW